MTSVASHLRGVRRLLLLLAAAVAIPVGLCAHEIGATQLTVTVQADGAFVLDILTDPDALLASVLGSEVATPVLDPAARDTRLASLAAAILAGVGVTADGSAVAATGEYLAPGVSGSAAGLATVRVRGALPRTARTLQVRYQWSSSTLPLAVQMPGAPARTHWISPNALSESIPIRATPRPALWRTVLQYVGLGFTHIVPYGFDHLLFVVGLCLLRLRWKTIVTQISAFTVAHSLTLTLTMLGVVTLPSRIVETLIALSIVYVAIENLVTSELSRSRTALVFGFGLLHGMGFASVLGELGLPKAELLPALLSFNVGVEGGQLAVVAAVMALVGGVSLTQERHRQFITVPASAAIAIMGLYWTVQRIF